MMEFNFNKDALLSAIKKNTHIIDGVSYTYDKEFDILRINLQENNNGKINNFDEPDNNGYIFFINGDGSSKKEIEIQSFLKDYQLNLYSKYLNKKDLSIIQNIHDQLIIA